jgi:hypothetical protein
MNVQASIEYMDFMMNVRIYVSSICVISFVFILVTNYLNFNR